MNIKPNLFKVIFSTILVLVVVYFIEGFYYIGELTFSGSLKRFFSFLFNPSQIELILWAYIFGGFLVIYILWSIFEKKHLSDYI